MTGILKDVQAQIPDAYKYLGPEIQRQMGSWLPSRIFI